MRPQSVMLVLGAFVSAHVPCGGHRTRCAVAFLPDLPVTAVPGCLRPVAAWLRRTPHRLSLGERPGSAARAETTARPVFSGGVRARGAELAVELDGANGGGDFGGGGRGWRPRRGRGGGGRGDEGGGQQPGRATPHAAVAAAALISRREILAAVAAATVLFGLAPASTAGMAMGRWMNQPFSAEDIPDLWTSDTVRRAIVTGANSGIGLETALELARKGWHVTLACRSRERGEAAVEKIKKSVPEARVALMLVDMSSQQSVKDFEQEYRKHNSALHLLINNAGIMLAPHSVTPDLIERTFATNYVGPFLLTNLLLPLLVSSSSQPFPSRVVNVGSEAHRWAPAGGIQFHLEQINNASAYDSLQDRWKWYGHSKLALLLFTKELDKKIPCFPPPALSASVNEGMAARNATKKVLVNCVHPGLIKSELFRDGGHCFPPFFGLLGRVAEAFALPFFRTEANGALTSLWAGTSPCVVQDNVHGEYVVPCQGWLFPSWLLTAANKLLTPNELPEGLRLEPWSTGQTVAPTLGFEADYAFDVAKSATLWDYSVALIGGKEQLYSPLRKRIESVASSAIWGASAGSLMWSVLADPPFDPALKTEGIHEPYFEAKMPFFAQELQQKVERGPENDYQGLEKDFEAVERDLL